MSRPTTPSGLSPRGSYVNLHSALLDKEGANSPSEKERLKAEMEVQAALLRKEDGAERAKKEEPSLPAGSPGKSRSRDDDIANDACAEGQSGRS